MRFRDYTVAALGLALGACSTATSAGDAALTSTAAGTSITTGVANFNSGVATAVANLNAGIAAAAPTLAMVCGATSYLDAAYKIAAPVAGASASDSANEAAAMAGVNALCAAPPTNVAGAAASALAGYVQVKSALAAVAPATAAAVAPVVAPAS